MKVMEEAQAGTLNPRDCQISVAPGNGTVKVTSKTPSLYEDYIQNMVRGKLEEYGVEADVTVEENGAIDYVIMARLEAALVKATRNDMPDRRHGGGRPQRTDQEEAVCMSREIIPDLSTVSQSTGAIAPCWIWRILSLWSRNMIPGIS